MKKAPELLKHKTPLSNWRTYPEGSVERAKALGLELLARRTNVEVTSKLWESECGIVAQEKPWRALGLNSQEDFIKAVTGNSEAEVRNIIARTQSTIKRAPEDMPKKGDVGNGRPRRSDIVRPIGHGNSSDYLAARLKRDHPEIAAAVERGEYRSIRAAAIAAGIVKVKTPLEKAVSAVNALSCVERAELRRRCFESKSILDKREVGRAQVGPRELKDPRSREYAIQTLYSLKRYAESLEIDLGRIEEELSEIERYQHWKVLGYSSTQAMLEAEEVARAAAAAQQWRRRPL